MSSDIVQEFLTRCFHPGDTVALLLRRQNPLAVTQRVVRVEKMLSPRYLSWLRFENHTGANVYVTANPLRPGSRKRTKECIAEVRHLYLDIDTDGEARLAALKASEAVPTPNVILSTSPNKYQALWSVEGFDFDRQEQALKSLALLFGGDSACTDRNRVLRVPGFRNCKYSIVHSITAEYLATQIYRPEDFKLPDSVLHFEASRDGSAATYPGSKNSRSEQDWLWVIRRLRLGEDAMNLTLDLAALRPDKSSPLYYAQRTVDIASARILLQKGTAIEEVITMLENRRSAEFPKARCASRAREITATALRMIERRKLVSNCTPKENHNATA